MEWGYAAMVSAALLLSAVIWICWAVLSVSRATWPIVGGKGRTVSTASMDIVRVAPVFRISSYGRIFSYGAQS